MNDIFYFAGAVFHILLALLSLFVVHYVHRQAPRRLDAGHVLDPSPPLHKLSSLEKSDLSLTTTFSTEYSMSYSWNGIATVVDPDDWLDECFITFQEHCLQCSASNGWFIDYSNYELIAKPAGLCAEFLACAFTKCDPTGFDEVFPLNLANTSFKDVKDKLGPLNLPQKIAFPATVFDVVGTVAQAIEEGRTISIKSTGHSYTGSHTMNGSIQLNFRDLQAYSSVVECPPFLSNASDNFAACSLANARGKDALVRVGGGETWNDVYNNVLNSAPQYEPLGGAAGSVGAAGGWLQGGGLSAGAERMYGLGVDQVLEIEMVLPDTRHVKFGPSNWEDAPGYVQKYIQQAMQHQHHKKISNVIVYLVGSFTLERQRLKACVTLTSSKMSRSGFGEHARTRLHRSLICGLLYEAAVAVLTAP